MQKIAKDVSRLKWIALLTSILILGTISWVFYDFVPSKPQIRAHCQQTSAFIDSHTASLHDLMNSTFDHAKTCGNNANCIQDVSAEIFGHLGDKFQDLTFAESTYFIRPSDGAIEKMFLDGRYYYKTVETPKEDLVLKSVSRGKAICAQGWKIDQSNSTMRYLYDIDSEAEIILPVTGSDVIVGAVVRIWGD